MAKVDQKTCVTDSHDLFVTLIFSLPKFDLNCYFYTHFVRTYWMEGFTRTETPLTELVALVLSSALRSLNSCSMTEFRVECLTHVHIAAHVNIIKYSSTEWVLITLLLSTESAVFSYLQYISESNVAKTESILSCIAAANYQSVNLSQMSIFVTLTWAVTSSVTQRPTKLGFAEQIWRGYQTPSNFENRLDGFGVGRALWIAPSPSPVGRVIEIPQ